MSNKFTATSVNTPFETLPETSFLVTPTGEAIYDNINVGKLPENWFPNPKTGSLGLDVAQLTKATRIGSYGLRGIFRRSFSH